MAKLIHAAFNITAEGSVVLEGDHSPGTSDSSSFDAAGISVRRLGVGLYDIHGPQIAWPDGWRASVFRDENEQPTLRLALSQTEDRLTVACTDPSTGEAKDIVYLLTLRVAAVVPETAIEAGI